MGDVSELALMRSQINETKGTIGMPGKTLKAIQQEADKKKVWWNEEIHLRLVDDFGETPNGCAWKIPRKKIAPEFIRDLCRKARYPVTPDHVQEHKTKEVVWLEEMQTRCLKAPWDYIVVPMERRAVTDAADDQSYHGDLRFTLRNVPMFVDSGAGYEVTAADLKEWLRFGALEENAEIDEVKMAIEALKVECKKLAHRLSRVGYAKFGTVGGMTNEVTEYAEEIAVKMREDMYADLTQRKDEKETELEELQAYLAKIDGDARSDGIQLEVASEDPTRGVRSFFVKILFGFADGIEDLLVKKMDWPGIKLAVAVDAQPTWVGRGEVPDGSKPYLPRCTDFIANMRGVEVTRLQHGFGQRKQVRRRHAPRGKRKGGTEGRAGTRGGGGGGEGGGGKTATTGGTTGRATAAAAVVSPTAAATAAKAQAGLGLTRELDAAIEQQQGRGKGSRAIHMGGGWAGSTTPGAATVGGTAAATGALATTTGMDGGQTEEEEEEEREEVPFAGDRLYLYHGQWKEGKEDGYGLRYSTEGAFEGEVKRGIKFGEGHLHCGNGDDIRGDFHPRSRFPDQALHENRYGDGVLQGEVEIKFSDGSAYFGEMVNGRIEGQGEYCNALGETKTGTFKDGELHGPDGKERDIVGQVFEGAWRHGGLHGEGRSSNPETGEYVGDWENGEKAGLGTCIFPGGNKFEGYFLDDDRFGPGSLWRGNVREAYDPKTGRKMTMSSKTYEGVWKGGFLRYGSSLHLNRTGGVCMIGCNRKDSLMHAIDRMKRREELSILRRQRTQDFYHKYDVLLRQAIEKRKNRIHHRHVKICSEAMTDDHWNPKDLEDVKAVYKRRDINVQQLMGMTGRDVDDPTALAEAADKLDALAEEQGAISNRTVISSIVQSYFEETSEMHQLVPQERLADEAEKAAERLVDYT